MKKYSLLLIAVLAISFNAYAQTDYRFSEYGQTKEAGSKIYLGLASGINNYTGLIGPTFEYQLSEKFSSYAGAGLGSWGYKLSAGVKYYANYPEGWAFNLGFSHATGLDNIEIAMMADYVAQPVPDETKIPFRLKGANTINLSAMKYWTLGRSGKNRFNIELGYAIPTAESQFEVKGGYSLTSEGNLFMNILQPGGIILGVGFSFGL